MRQGQSLAIVLALLAIAHDGWMQSLTAVLAVVALILDSRHAQAEQGERHDC